jgi:hypothetical protein
MIRYVPALAVPAIIGLPLWVAPSWGIGAIAAVAGIFCAIGVLRLSLASIAIGGVLALIALALALWWSSSSVSVFGAVAFGLALLFLLDAVCFASRFAGAEIDPTVWRRQVAWWIGRAAVASAAAVILMVIASALALALPSFGRPIIAGAGALAAFAAAILKEASGKEEAR